eukprot:2666322-Rhodomonas_salina.3
MGTRIPGIPGYPGYLEFLGAPAGQLRLGDQHTKLRLTTGKLTALQDSSARHTLSPCGSF